MPTLTWLTRESDFKKAKQANFRILENMRLLILCRDSGKSSKENKVEFPKRLVGKVVVDSRFTDSAKPFLICMAQSIPR